MPLNLNRPLVCFDLETTGVNTSADRIVDIALVKLHPHGEKEKFSTLVDPVIPIPPGATAVHGISNVDVKGKPVFSEIAEYVYTFFSGCDITGYNCRNFDVVLLAEEFGRCGYAFPETGSRVIDVFKIFTKKEERTLSAAYRFYCSKDIENAHNAMADTEATLEILQSQIERYSDIGATVEELSAYTGHDERNVDFAGKLKYNSANEIVYAFGKHTGQRVVDNLDYAMWMLDADFAAETKAKLRKILESRQV